MFFNQALTLDMNLEDARACLLAHPQLDLALRRASIVAYGDGLATLSADPTADYAAGPAGLTVLTLPPYLRAGAPVIALRWLTDLHPTALEESEHLLIDANLELRHNHESGAELHVLGSYQPVHRDMGLPEPVDHRAALHATMTSFLHRASDLATVPRTGTGQP